MLVRFWETFFLDMETTHSENVGFTAVFATQRCCHLHRQRHRTVSSWGHVSLHQKTCRTLESSLFQEHSLPQVQPASKISVWSAVAWIVGHYIATKGMAWEHGHARVGKRVTTRYWQDGATEKEQKLSVQTALRRSDLNMHRSCM